jgi:hypothetical protein
MSLQPKFYNTYIPFSVHEAQDLPIKECHSSPNFIEEFSNRLKGTLFPCILLSVLAAVLSSALRAPSF